VSTLVDSELDSAEPIRIGVPRETFAGERRVALIPDTVAKMVSSGLTVLVESGAGSGAFFSDEAYSSAGASVVPDSAALYAGANLIAKVRGPNEIELEQLRRGSVLIGFLDPLRNPEMVDRLSERGIIAFSMDAIPRITRAQSMDALSSMSTLAGYKSVLMAADTFGRVFPMLMTAAGTLAPARLLVLGAGVAGLQALATARRLGAVTEGFDTRAAVREQVESVGASFVEMPVALEDTEGEGGYAKAMSEDFYGHEREAIREHVSKADIVITTALIPGKPAPCLITEEMVQSMRPGSVIVDLSSEAGGNCELTVRGETIVRYGVTVMGPVNIASSLSIHASQMYARNIQNVINHLVKDGHLHLDFEDEITRVACMTRAAPATT
jgi:H+-translocating NAD(P) transhydrogenase subunit alpha